MQETLSRSEQTFLDLSSLNPISSPILMLSLNFRTLEVGGRLLQAFSCCHAICLIHHLSELLYCPLLTTFVATEGDKGNNWNHSSLKYE